MMAVVYLWVLVYAVWQDLRYRSLGRGFLLIAGMAGWLLRMSCGGEWHTVILSSTVGAALLGLSYLTDGGIGEGDGWFFVITGFFLSPAENVLLFLSGVAFCSIYSLTLTAAAVIGGGSVRKKKLPFLPYVLPVGLWLALL